ncbi:protein kinase superfamily protein [Actinidia rufa]|uniref:Protein kinase superfamily protein n=1 Tax=Actinidia rufa TaxID=165716 RepID=A0A7J0EGQ7_9ERIC|nr:protein kinase superfamily protein [Actinidia rufa]
MFYLPNADSSSSCLSDFQSKLDAMSFPRTLVSECLGNSTQYVVNRTSCAGITTTQDWVEKAGAETLLDSSCEGDLTGLTRCSLCLDAGMKVNAQLVSLDKNATKCFYYAVLYAAGIVNEFGPEDVRTAACILALPLASSKSRNSSSKDNLYKWLFGSLGACMGVLFAMGLILLYRMRDKRKKQKALHEEYVTGVKARVLPNTGAKWFSLAELEQATKGFPQRNMIGQGGYGVVYRGILSDGTVVAIKQILNLDTKGDDEFVNEVEIISKIKHKNLLSLRVDVVSRAIHQEAKEGLAYLHYGIKPSIYHRDIKATNILLDSEMRARLADFGMAKQKHGRPIPSHHQSCWHGGPRGVMERFVLVGILCAHVMVALRPTISDALKMLEGDIDIPKIPDRPLPLSHESFRSSLWYSASMSERSRAC